MKPEFIIGYVELVYNANGHTYWLEGIINDQYYETHWDGEKMYERDGLKAFLKDINPEYWAENTEFFYSGWKRYSRYNIWW